MAIAAEHVVKVQPAHDMVDVNAWSAENDDVYVPQGRLASSLCVMSEAGVAGAEVSRRLSSLGSLHHAGHSECRALRLPNTIS